MSEGPITRRPRVGVEFIATAVLGATVFTVLAALVSLGILPLPFH